MTAQLDELLGPRDIERIFGKTRRWIAELIKRGEFPSPDRPGRRGSPNQWRRSTIEKHLDAIAPRRDVQGATRTASALNPSSISATAHGGVSASK